MGYVTRVEEPSPEGRFQTRFKRRPRARRIPDRRESPFHSAGDGISAQPGVDGLGDSVSPVGPQPPPPIR